MSKLCRALTSSGSFSCVFLGVSLLGSALGSVVVCGGVLLVSLSRFRCCFRVFSHLELTICTCVVLLRSDYSCFLTAIGFLSLVLAGQVTYGRTTSQYMYWHYLKFKKIGNFKNKINCIENIRKLKELTPDHSIKLGLLRIFDV